MTSAAQPSPDGLVERDAELGPGGRTAPGREETTPGAHRAGRQRRVTVAAWLGLHGRRAVGRRPGSRRRGRRFLHGLPDGHCRAVPAWRPGTADSRQQRHPDSSQNTMAARRRRAPARILGPVLSHPTGDRPLVTLDGAAGGPLQPVVQPVAQQLPDVAAMVGDPVSRSITVVMRSRVQWSVWKPCARAPCRSAWSMAASWGRQACGRPDGAGAAQCLQPTCLPAAGVLSGDARLAGDLGLGAAGGKQYNNRTSRLPAMPGLTSLAPTWRRIR